MKGRMVRGLMTCIVMLGSAGLALAGERKVPGSYSTIQSAVDASAAGDVVVCAAGTYTEAVVATKSNITIQGAAGAIWDGGTGTSAVTCLDVTGNAVVVTGFKFKNGVDHCRLTGNDCKIKNCVSEDARGVFCHIQGVRSRVDTCRVDRAGDRAVKCVGNSAFVIATEVYDCADIGFDVEGDDCDLRDCRAERCDKGGYRCKGNRHDVRDCEAWSCKEYGFNLLVEASVFLRGYARECGNAGGSGAGFLCEGSDNYFNLCDTYKCKPHGHKCKGDRNRYEDNWCDYSDEDGFRHEGNDNECEYNQARYCGRDGYHGNGDRNDYRSCDSYDNREDGFDCERGSDNSYRYCRGKWNDGAGCNNGGTSTDVYYSTFLYNSVDIGLAGTGCSFGSFSLNTYVSGSITGILNILL